MTPNEYQQHCLRTWQGGGGRSTTEELANAGMGLAGEAGEVANALKKVLWYGQPLDVEAIADELGDVLYYAAILANRLGVTFEAVMAGNVEKLAKRHPDGFDRSRYADDMRPRGALADVGPDYKPAPVDNENGRVYRCRLGAMAMKYLDVPSSIINMWCEHTAFGDSISIRPANEPSIYNQTDADALAKWLRAGYRVTCPNDDGIVQRVLDAYGELGAE